MHVTSMLMVCPNCSTVIGHNSYFGGFICENCGWEETDKNSSNKKESMKQSEFEHEKESM